MTTFDNQPPPADWVQPIGNLCGSCTASANLCHCLTVLPGEVGCCPTCTHREPPSPPEVQVWMGED